MASDESLARTGSLPRVLRPSPHDLPIIRLALPALGALAVEPLYVLVDTAIVGHLGSAPAIASKRTASASRRSGSELRSGSCS
jgi:hypothetical protein